MKKIKLLTPILVATASVATALPLSSCANSVQHISITIDGKTKSIEANAITYYIFSLDKDSYVEKDFTITLSGDHSGDLTVKPVISNNLLILNVGCPDPYDTEATYNFTVKFETKDWTQEVSGLTLKVNGTKQSEDVDSINEVLHSFETKPSTMSQLISKLEEKLIFFEDLTVTQQGYQWVWDSEQNIIFVMNNKGQAAIAPKGYKINKNLNNIWKMVAGNKTTFTLHSATNDDMQPQKDAFDSSSKYSQYLRSDEQFTTDLTFCSGLDTGVHEKLNLTFKKDLSTSTQPVVINTMKSSLTIEGSLNDIEHHGNLSELKVDSIDSTKSYSEYGSVDSVITIKSGTINLEKGSDVNSIVVTADSSSDVAINVTKEGSVGNVSATNETVASELETKVVVVDPETPKEQKPTIDPDPVLEPSEDNEFYSGDGSAKSPWTIKTKAQLDNFAKRVKNQSFPVLGQTEFYFNLIADIDYENGEWTPVGNDTTPFKGIFNGCGFSIKNIKYVSETPDDKPKTGHLGLFGKTVGEENTQYTKHSDIWVNNELNETAIKEEKYTTVIKYLTIENVNAVNTSKYFVGGIAGAASNTYFYKCNVLSGTINGIKHTGGIAGTMGGCICKECSVGDETNSLAITSDIYHVGGITGSTGSSDVVKADSCFAFIDCTTSNKVTISTNAATNGGAVGGIAGDNQSAASVVYDGCINQANINVTSASTSSYPSYVGGIAGFGQNVKVIANCINMGNITITDGSYVKYVAGMSTSPYTNESGHIFYYDTNLGNISGYVVADGGMAGIAAGVGTDKMPTFTVCSNLGQLNNSGPGPKGDIYSER